MSPRVIPKAEKPKTIEVKARIDEETNDKLIRYCEKYQLSRLQRHMGQIQSVLS